MPDYSVFATQKGETPTSQRMTELGTYGGVEKIYGLEPGMPVPHSVLGGQLGSEELARRGGVLAPQWTGALGAAEERTRAAQEYMARVEQQRTAAQQQLGAGITGTRADLMAGAGARGLSPALGRAAGYAGGELQQRGVGMAQALQARETAAAQAQLQQALAAQQQMRMGMGQQIVGRFAAETGQAQALAALQAQAAAAAQARQQKYMMAGIGAGSSALGMLGGAFQGGQQSPTWTPEYQQQYQQWAETYSDSDLKAGVKQPVSAAEARLLNALRAEGARTEAALEAAMGRAIPPQQAIDARVDRLTQQLQAEGARTEQRLGAMSAVPPGIPSLPPGLRGAAERQRMQQQTLGSLAGAGRQYQYTPQAQQQLGQPPGVQYGPMAQDLARTELGRSAVVPTPAGLAVDTGRLSLIQAGLMGQQEQRLQEIERQLKAEGRKTEARLEEATR